VVAGPARRNHGNSGFCTDTVEAGEQLSQQRLRDGVLSLFSAKDPMDEVLGNLCATVVSSLAGRYLNPIANPALTRRAFLYRACGTRILEIRSLRRFNIGGWTVRSLCRRPLT